MEEEYKRMKEKMEAVKARNKVLSNDLKSCKQQMTVLTDKGRHDNELIEALMVNILGATVSALGGYVFKHGVLETCSHFVSSWGNFLRDKLKAD